MLFFLPAVIAAAWIGRLGAALLSTALSTTVVLWFFAPPIHSFATTPRAEFVELVASVCVALSISGCIEAMHHANDRARTELTKRRVLGDALLQRERQLRFVTDQAPVMIVQCDAAGRYTFANAPYAARFGRRPSELIGRHLCDVEGPDAYAELKPRLTVVLRGERAEFESRIVGQKNEPRWLHCVWVPQTGPGGTVIGAVAVLQDISSRKASESALRESEARFRGMANGLPLLVWMHDAAGVQEFVNSAFCDFLAVRPEEMRGDRWRQLLHPDDADAYGEAYLAAVQARQPFHAEARVRRADGAWRWIESWASPRLSDRGEYLGMVGVSADLTNRRETELALRASEADARARAEELAAVMQAVPALLFLAHDPECRRISGSRAIGDLLHLAVDRNLSLSATDSDHPANMRTFCAGRELTPAELPMQQAAATGRVVRDCELTLQFDDGRTHDILGNAVPLFTADGRVRGAVGAFIDITERKRFEHQLQAARDEAVAASRAKDDFIALLSHELRTPLTPVLLIANEAAANLRLPASVREDFAAIERNIALEVRLIDDLLDFNRIVRGKVTFECELLDVHVILRDAFDGVRDQVTAAGLTATFQLSATAATVRADPVRLRQVFWNVFKNAVKFTPRGGRITVVSSVDVATAAVEIVIRDTGLGMTAEELGRAFDPFVQGRHAQASAGDLGGLGLGLTVCRRLIEGQGGTIAAASAGLNRGTAVTIRLALALQSEIPLPSPDADAGSGSPGVTLGQARVLLVEDHEATRAALGRILQHHGLVVTSAGSIAEARRQAAGQKFDLLVSDLGLPDGDGCELLGELVKGGGPVPAIAITGYGMNQDIDRSRAAGFGEHLVKPVNAGALNRGLARSFGRVSCGRGPTAST